MDFFLTYLPYAIATAFPLIFIFIVYKRDIYKSGSALFIGLSLGWGVIAFGIAFLIQQNIIHDFFGLDVIEISQFVAPFVEEILKLILIIFLVRRKKFHYFIDGAIYGFAIGIGFAIAENFLYIQIHQSDAISTIIGRILSANLMHASATGLVGVSAGIARFQKPLSFIFTISVGSLAAIFTHAVYNGIVSNSTVANRPTLTLVLASLVGIATAYTIVTIIRLGIKEQKRWIEDQFAKASGANQSTEVDITYLADDWDKLELPIIETFGEEKGEQILQFLRLQAQLGINKMEAERLAATGQTAYLIKKIENLQKQITPLKEEIGSYHMMTLSTIFSFEEYGFTE